MAKECHLKTDTCGRSPDYIRALIDASDLCPRTRQIHVCCAVQILSKGPASRGLAPRLSGHAAVTERYTVLHLR
jgi:hypothetical protein